MLRGFGRRETSIGHTFRLCDKLVSKLVRSVAFPKTLYITNGNLMVRRYDDQGSLVPARPQTALFPFTNSNNTITMSADYKVILIATISFVAGGIMSRLTTGMQAGKLLTPDAVLTNRSFYNAPIQNIAKSRGANISTFEHVQDNQQFPTSPSFIEEIVPPELYKYQYAPDKLRFNVSKSMLRRSRPIIGNNERLHAYIEKLHAKLCTTVLFLGGSVTDGHNVRGGAEQAYPRYFQFWLNGRYPCKNEDGSPGQHTIKKTHAQNSQTHFIHWSMVSEIDKIDLVFIEFNIVRYNCLVIVALIQNQFRNGCLTINEISFHYSPLE